MQKTENGFVSANEAAEMMGISVEKLEFMRKHSRGPDAHYQNSSSGTRYLYHTKEIEEYINANEEERLLIDYRNKMQKDELDIKPRSDSFFIPSFSEGFALLIAPDSAGIQYLWKRKKDDLATFSYKNPYLLRIHVLYVVDRLYRAMFFQREYPICVDSGMANSACLGGGRFKTLPYTAVIDSVAGGVKFVPDRDAVAALDFSYFDIWVKDEICKPALDFLERCDVSRGGIETKPGIWLDWGRLKWLLNKPKQSLNGKSFAEWEEYKSFCPKWKFQILKRD